MLWTLSDHQGSVRDLVDSNGSTQNHISYDSFGKITAQINPALDTRFGYTGREEDQETGQRYHRARYVDPTVGSFINQDPSGFEAGDANLYRYVGNSPTNRIDPTGEDWLYQTLNKADQLAAGFGDTVTFGATTRVREALYGDTATQNHSGGFFHAGQAAGVVVSTAVGFGAAGNAARGGWAVRAAQGYTVAGDAVGAYQSTKNLHRGVSLPLTYSASRQWLAM